MHIHRHWLTRPARSALTALIMILLALSIGITGYHYLGQLPWVDSLLEASMILGGMGAIAPMHNDTIKLFAAAYALFSGLALLSSTSVLLAPWVHSLLTHHQRSLAEKTPNPITPH